MSVDHEPGNETEKGPIEQKGGFVSNMPGDVPRVDGQLTVFRTSGDKSLKLVGHERTWIGPGRPGALNMPCMRVILVGATLCFAQVQGVGAIAPETATDGSLQAGSSPGTPWYAVVMVILGIIGIFVPVILWILTSVQGQDRDRIQTEGFKSVVSAIERDRIQTEGSQSVVFRAIEDGVQQVCRRIELGDQQVCRTIERVGQRMVSAIEDGVQRVVSSIEDGVQRMSSSQNTGTATQGALLQDEVDNVGKGRHIETSNSRHASIVQEDSQSARGGSELCGIRRESGLLPLLSIGAFIGALGNSSLPDRCCHQGIRHAHGSLQTPKLGVPSVGLADLTGIQIGQATSGIYKGALGDRVHLSNLNDLLLQDNRYGERTGKGYYNYPKGSRVEQPAPELDDYLARTRQASSLIPHGKVVEISNEIVKMTFFDEACRVADLDIASVLGMGFRAYRGDSVGVDHIYSKLKHWHGSFYKPSAALERAAHGNYGRSTPERVSNYVANNYGRSTPERVSNYVANNYGRSTPERVSNYVANNYGRSTPERVSNYVANNYGRSTPERVSNYVANNYGRSTPIRRRTSTRVPPHNRTASNQMNAKTSCLLGVQFFLKLRLVHSG